MDPSSLNYSQPSSSGLAIFTGVWLIVWLVIAVILIVAYWKIFTKARKPGWAAIIPIYNVIVELEIIGRPLWWIILLLIPIVNIVVAFIIAIDLAKSFGKSAAWGFFLLGLFSFIGGPILGFGDAKYLGPSAAGGSSMPGTPPTTPSTSPQPPAKA